MQRLFTKQNNQMYLLIFKSAWQTFAMVFIFGSLYLTFENLAMYARMEAELEKR